MLSGRVSFIPSIHCFRRVACILAITLFPNPSSGTFNFKSLDQNSGTISIYNSTGQKVYEQKVSGLESTINANGLENGLYHVIFNSEDSGKIAAQKLIISK